MSTTTVSSWTATNVESPNAKGAVPVYVDGLAGASKGVIVIQEWWGITTEIKTLALEWFRGNGSAYAVAVPDLYRGKVTDDREEAGHMMHGLDFKGAVQDIHATAKYLLDQGVKSVAVVGFCMGGALTLASAVEPTPVKVVVPFYGIPPAAYFPHDQIKVTAQLHFALLDDLKGFSDPDTARALRDTLKKNNDKTELFLYEKATHAFCNPTHVDPEHGNAAACALARGRVLDFLAASL